MNNDDTASVGRGSTNTNGGSLATRIVLVITRILSAVPDTDDE